MEHGNLVEQREDQEQPDDAMATGADQQMPEGAMVGMSATMETVQVICADAIKTIMHVSSMLRNKPSLIEMYRRGNMCNTANERHRGLDVLGEIECARSAQAIRNAACGTTRILH